MENVLKEVLIEDKAEKEGKNGVFFEYKLLGKTYRWFTKDSASQEKARSVKKGDVVNVHYTTTTKGEFTYKNITNIEKLEGVTEPRQAINGQEYGMIFNNAVRVILEGGKSQELETVFDEVFDKLMALNIKKRKQYNV